jgi:hypothetical protein
MEEGEKRRKRAVVKGIEESSLGPRYEGQKKIDVINLFTT